MEWSFGEFVDERKIFREITTAGFLASFSFVLFSKRKHTETSTLESLALAYGPEIFKNAFSFQ